MTDCMHLPQTGK